jgi:hypothetical protein
VPNQVFINACSIEFFECVQVQVLGCMPEIKKEMHARWNQEKDLWEISLNDYH